MFQETGAVTRFPSAVMPERLQTVERDAQTSPGEILAVLWRRRLWIALGTLGGLIAAVAFLTLVTPRYMAVAQLLIDPNDLRVMDNAVTPSNTLNEAATAYVESQVRVLTSDTVLRKVIEQQKLDKDPEFAAPPSAIRTALDLVLTRFGFAAQRVPQNSAVPVLQELAPKIGARRQERTYVVDLTASTRDPEKSARIANAIIAAYLEDQSDARMTAAKRATDALSGRLQELKDRVRDAENRAETFKAQNNLVSASGQLVSEQQLSELTNQLTVAGAKADEAKARLDQIEMLRRGKVDAGAIAEAVQSQTVAALRAQHAEVLRRKAELTARLGERHPSIADINAQAHDLQQLIDREVARLAQAARGDHERAQATRQALLARLNGLKQEAVTTNQALVRLRELEREVEASRAVYQAYLMRSRETSEQERVNTTNVRVLSEANVPNKRAFPPRTLIVLALALAFGAAAGAGLGFARDWTDDRIHTRRDLEAACSLPILAEIAAIADESWPRGWWPWLHAKLHAWRRGDTVMATLLDAPNSDFAAGIQRLRYVLRAAATNATPTILLLSPGKPGARSDVSLNLALAAASGGSRVLLADADFKRRELSSRVVGGNGAGLLDIAANSAKLEQALIAEAETGLMVLQAGRGANGSWPSNPESIKRALDQARGGYTMIVDGPSDSSDPLATVLAASADFVVLVATTGVTRTREIAEFQRSADFPTAKLRGVVLVSGTGVSL
jgi:succinoglycan biosynthesis transport protein ExoP